MNTHDEYLGGPRDGESVQIADATYRQWPANESPTRLARGGDGRILWHTYLRIDGRMVYQGVGPAGWLKPTGVEL